MICFQVDECRCFLSSNNVRCNIRCGYFDFPLCLFYFGSESANGLEFANVLDLLIFTKIRYVRYFLESVARNTMTKSPNCKRELVV